MKKIRTDIISNQRADLAQIDDIIRFLFEEEHIWLTLYDTSKKNPNYIQIHSEVDITENEVVEFLTSIKNSSWRDAEQESNGCVYMMEARKYDSQGDFKHYRAFISNPEIVQDYFRKYFLDEDFSVEGWLDVTQEFE